MLITRQVITGATTQSIFFHVKRQTVTHLHLGEEENKFNFAIAFDHLANQVEIVYWIFAQGIIETTSFKEIEDNGESHKIGRFTGLAERGRRTR